MKCLNIKSPEFITLYNKTTVHPLKLLMMVNKYFSDNPDVEEMPTTTQLGLTAKDLKQSVTKVDEHLLSLEQDGFISYQNNEVEYKGVKYSKKGFLRNMYGLSVSDNAEGSIDPVAYFSLRKSTANNLLTALNEYISTQEELNQYFKTYIDNSPNVFDAIRNNDAFVEYVKGIIGEQKETLQVEYDVDDSLPSINVYAGNYENLQFSNFTIRPFNAGVETNSGYNVYKFSSVEQAFHFAKAAMVNNASVAKEILKTTNGKILKQLTNKENLKMTQEQVKAWDNVSKDIMTEFIYQSFLQNLYHGELLLSTGKERITHNQDNTRWKKDFPDALMTARKKLKQITDKDYTLIGKTLNRKPTQEEIFNLQVKINNVFFEEMVDSKEFKVVDSDIEDSKPRQLKYSDYQKLFFNDLKIVSDPENLLLFEVFEEKFESFVIDSTDVSLDAFINNMQLFFDEYYNPNLSEEQSNGIQEVFVRLEKILPDISPFKIIDRNNFVEGQLDLFETEELKPQQQQETDVKLGMQDLIVETAKGSTYRYLPDGRTQRFKKVEQREYEPQDILVFVPDYQWIKNKNPNWLNENSLDNESEYLEFLLDRIQGENKVWIVDSEGNKIETNSKSKEVDKIFIAFANKDEKIVDFIPVSKEPVKGFYTYDSRIYRDKKGIRMRERHLGNKVVKITRGNLQQQPPQQPITESKKPMSFVELMQLPQVNNSVNLYLRENPNMTVNEIINKLIIDGIINKDCTI